jgi:hypothetical protein
MKEDPENIDLLINRNTDRQLSAVDWDRLYGRIQKRLDDAEKQTGAVSIKVRAIRWAAAIASAAAVLIFIFLLTDNRHPELSLSTGQQAAVELTQYRTTVKTEIAKPAPDSFASVVINAPAEQTLVSIGPPDVQVVQCRVVIIDQNEQAEKDQTPLPSWIMMMASKPAAPENYTDKNQLDIACLL